MMEQKGFGLGIALAWLKPVPPHSSAQSPSASISGFNLIPMTTQDCSALISFLSLLLKLKHTKPSELYSLKVPFINLIFINSIFKKKKPFRQFQTLSEGWLIFTLSS